MRRTSLLAKLALTNIAIILVPFSLMTYLVFFRLMGAILSEQESASYYATGTIRSALEDKIEILNSVSRSLIMSGSVRAFASLAISGPGGPGYAEAYSKAIEALSLFAFQDNAIAGITFFPIEGKAITAGPSPDAELGGDEREEARALAGGWFWSARGDKVSMCRLVRNIYDLSDRLGYLKITIDAKRLAGLLVPARRPEDLAFALASADGSMLSCPLGSEARRSIERALAGRGGILEGGAGQVRLSIEPIRGFDLARASALKDGRTFLITIEKDKVRAYRRQYVSMAILALFFIAAITLANLLLYRRLIFRPLNELQELMKSIENEDFSVRFNSGVGDEISQLVDQFNRMSDKLRFLHEEVYQGNLRLKEAELKELQAQINPHFLFNTLDTIYWAIALGKQDKAGNMVRQLSTMLRVSLDRRGQGGFVMLEEEIEHIRCYLELQKERYDSRLTYSIDVPRGLPPLKVLKFVLQPIVENAVIHGIGPKGGGAVAISIDAQEDRLEYRVLDDGVGIDVQAVERLLSGGAARRETESIGLTNIDERIKLHFGEGYGITALSPEEGGSLFIVTQPAVREGAT